MVPALEPVVARMKSGVRLPACQAAIRGPLFVHGDQEIRIENYKKKKRHWQRSWDPSQGRVGSLVCPPDLGEEENFESQKLK